MRNLKFRVWSANRNEYLEDDEFYIGSFGSAGFSVVDPDGGCEIPNCIIEQFTGLTDKNGKEIYEGDIIHKTATVEWFDYLTWDSGGSPHPGFYCKEWMEYKQDLSYHSGFTSDVEVTGNIHENKVEPKKDIYEVEK